MASTNLMALLEAALQADEDDEARVLSEGDRDMVERLVGSLAIVCKCVRAAEGYEGRVWRRRLDSARRVLDGEMEGGLF